MDRHSEQPASTTNGTAGIRQAATRRAFLGAALASATTSLVSAPAYAAGQKISLVPKLRSDVMRVRVEMDVKGNVRLPGNPLVSRSSKVSVPIESDAVLDYEERYRRPSGADARSEVTWVDRFYHTANSTSRLNKTTQKVELRPSVKQTVVRRESLPEVIYSQEDFLTQEEIGLLRVPVCSAGLDNLLPSRPVAIGEKYELDTAALASVLNLTSIETNEVSVEVKEITAKEAKFQLSGNVSGTIEGVPTKIRVLGKLTFDQNLGACTWLAMALHETREIGNAEPGFDVAATVKLIRQPLPRPIGLPKTPAAVTWNQPVPSDRLYVELSSRNVGFMTLMDRRWRMMRDVTGSAMIRMIENDISIAQCNFRSLAKLKPGQQWTLEAFQADARQTIGDQFSQMVSADQTLSAQNLRVMRLVADGSAEGVPVRWIMLHFSDDTGRRLLATFTMSGNHVAQFAGTDTQMADSLSLLEIASSKDNAVTDASPAANSTTPGGADGTKPGVSPAKNSSARVAEVQSASDLR